MALDELTLLINRCRRLQDTNELGCNDDKIGEIRDKIADLLSKSNERVIIKCSYEKEICMGNFFPEDYYDWIIDRLIDSGKSQVEVLADDIRDDCTNYIDWDDSIITVEDKDGNELHTF